MRDFEEWRFKSQQDADGFLRRHVRPGQHLEFLGSVSNNGQTWSDPIASGPGTLGITTITSPPQTARYLRIAQTGTNTTHHWSIYELDVFYSQ